MEALKPAIHILNRVPSKAVPKTPYELWTGREPSLKHLRVWGSSAEAKVFNPNIRKLDPKTISCHFIGYPEKSKGFRFYYSDIYIKFVETRHAVILEDEMMRESTIARKIDLEEKRVCVPTPMTQEPFFELLVLVAPTVRDTVVPTPVVSSPVVTVNNDEEHVLQEPIQTNTIDEGEQQQPQTEDVPNVEAPRRSQRVRRSAIHDDYEVYNTKEFQMEGDPTSFEEAMRSDNSSK
jgi:hypothetical protein